MTQTANDPITAGSGSELAGQVALVTGGGRGIGAAVAGLLAEMGAAVAVLDWRSELAHAQAASIVARGGRAHACVADMSDEAAVHEAVQEVSHALGDCTILINNAAVVGPALPFTCYPTAAFRQVVETNLFGVFYALQATVPGMVTAGYGRIVNVASIAAQEGLVGVPGYTSTKSGVIGLTKSLGVELAETGVLVNAVLPGSIRTELAAESTAEPSEETKTILEMRHRNRLRAPMGRMAEPIEVAEMVAWLSSPRCSYTTGSVFDISGGRGRS